ncbi:MAG: IS66 family transposase [Pseudomonadota bacterium]|nr:IS66 family transposase [Pseudomonadota bacterium]
MRFEQQVLRCSACQHRYTAPLPDGVAPEKYDASADVVIAMAKYAAGLPFHRLARMQAAFGIPLPGSVQFERCEAVADAVLPIFLHLRDLAARGQVIYLDDTRVKILECVKENKQLAEDQRRGVQTTGIVARVDGHQIALYQSGRRHAGENIDELLRHRPRGLSPPIQMSDAQANNWSREFATIIAKCLAHARRQFVEIEAAFPAECKRVLDDLAEVYRIDAETRGMSDGERLQYHQQLSGPIMADLRVWVSEQLAERSVEPNSGLGQALRYMQRHWEGLTRFLNVAGTPLDSNAVERALKLVVLHRKNALFFKTEHGAAVGDILMSLIETCRMGGVSAWDYLLAIVRNARVARKTPADWLPWNYPREELVRRAA